MSYTGNRIVEERDPSQDSWGWIDCVEVNPIKDTKTVARAIYLNIQDNYSVVPTIESVKKVGIHSDLRRVCEPLCYFDSTDDLGDSRIFRNRELTVQEAIGITRSLEELLVPNGCK